MLGPQSVKRIVFDSFFDTGDGLGLFTHLHSYYAVAAGKPYFRQTAMTHNIAPSSFQPRGTATAYFTDTTR